MNGALIYFDASRKNIYINTVTEVDSTGQPEDDGAIYLNKQKWPNQDGSNNQVLKTNGSGVLSWANEGSAPNVFTTFSSDSGSTTANSTTDTLEIRGGTDIGTFTLDGQQEAIIQKDPSDQLFAANAAVMAVGVAINSN